MRKFILILFFAVFSSLYLSACSITNTSKKYINTPSYEYLDNSFNEYIDNSNRNSIDEYERFYSGHVYSGVSTNIQKVPATYQFNECKNSLNVLQGELRDDNCHILLSKENATNKLTNSSFPQSTESISYQNTAYTSTVSTNSAKTNIYIPPSRMLSPSLKGISYAKPVYVRGYFRKNGTYVRPHTRSYPRRRSFRF